jgi:hypothetical protein
MAPTQAVSRGGGAEPFTLRTERLGLLSAHLGGHLVIG